MRTIKRQEFNGQAQDHYASDRRKHLRNEACTAGASVGTQDKNSNDNGDHLAGLNGRQRQAVKYGVKAGNATNVAPLLVIAGAGTGKTMTVAHRVAHLLATGISPHRVLLLTFTRRAAREMIRRVRRISAKGLRGARLDLPWSGTFHAIGARLLRQHAYRIGLKPNFSILDRGDAADLMNLARHDAGQSKKKKRFPQKDACLAIYSRTVNSGTPLDDVLKKHFPWCLEWKDDLRTLFTLYVKAKRRQNALDYDDLLLYWAEMLNDEKLAAEIGGRFDHILVDEYQDTNSLQAKILLKLRPDGRGVMVVGDDAQAIYSFRAATVRNILDFPKQFQPPACVIALEENYRSTQPILHACNEVMKFAKERFTKNLWSARKSQQKPYLTTVADEAVQASYVAQQILRAREAGVSLRQQAVLFRSSNHSTLLELELARRNIPFRKYCGLKFIETAHVKDVICILRWCTNAQDRVAGFRILQLLPGIGQSTANKILDQIATEGKVVGVLKRFAVPQQAAEDWPGFVSLIARLRNAEVWPGEFQALRTWYEPQLHRLYDDAELRAEDIARLQHIAGGFRSRERFLTELTLDPPEAKSGHAQANDLDEEYTILSTIHSAKGGEWQHVYVLNVVDGCIPSNLATRTSEEIEEERRLLHVAMTRAKDELDLIVPQRIYLYQQLNDDRQNAYATRSRFIPNSILGAFEQKHWAERATERCGRNNSQSRKIDVAARVEGMWE